MTSIAKNKRVIIIGAGFSSLSASCYLSKAGYEVSIYEKNGYSGGRARQLKRDGFVFDMGPTFYWMPDVFESFFADFGFRTDDFYELTRLNPGYEIYFGEEYSIKIGSSFEAIKSTFESIEKGSGEKLQSFMNIAEENYNIAVKDLVYKPGESIMEIITPKTTLKIGSFLQSVQNQIFKRIKNDELRRILEFPVLFLGAKPSNTPAFYNFMNYADFKLGTWHPKGGVFEVGQAIHSLAVGLGVKISHNQSVEEILIENSRVVGIQTHSGVVNADIVLSGADYHFTETLLPKQYRQYSNTYWNKKTFAPSALLFYVGFKRKLKNLSHHTLFFDVDFDQHASTIYDTFKWPEKPLFYASFPSITDNTVAPEGKEAGIFLIPIATGLNDTKELRKKYLQIILERIEKVTKQSLVTEMLFSESYCVSDFISDYNSFKGNAYGLANTLLQTHILRPKMKSKKVDNLYFTGQLTVPGPGIPPSLISGKVVSSLIKKYHAL